ncbi:SDR family oxidoreductase [Sediminitomix flava]|uniref:3-oxoacyl-[acyl-carrier protein] reductase n=1 Tax=Sediminitomix flava TaxID=379075 RepID=A0A315ZBC8_SEDFL|nr:SDR family oxidoreductase [Sediminitomix flava]PWJ42108.1 3-oxoacyl-[acyl-carrier protein] reductase [Sediminitomix flava]
MNIDLTNKNALVCGSSQGIGFASAIELAKLGANVILLARNQERLEKALDSIPNNGTQNHQLLCANFDEPNLLKKVIDDFLTDHKPIHVLVNNTGGPNGGPIINAELDEFENAFSRHLKCNHILMQAVLESMKSEGYGRIINVISTSVKAPLNGLGVSNTIRGAVASWAKTVSNEVAKYGITVNNVLPGATMTARLESIIAKKAEKLGTTSEAVSQEMMREIPAQRFGEAQEVANAVAFLATPAASYINGINVPVDGGRTPSL